MRDLKKIEEDQELLKKSLEEMLDEVEKSKTTIETVSPIQDEFPITEENYTIGIYEERIEAHV